MTDSQGSDIEVIPENEGDEGEPLEYDIAIIPADYTLEVLYQKWKDKEFELPKFQRAFVWSKVQSSLLIDSFLMGLPVPPIFLHVLPDQKYEIIDGRQRLQSVFFYIDGFFGEPSITRVRHEFSIEGTNPNSRWANKTFKELEDVDKRRLKNAVLRAMIIRQLKPSKSDSSIYYIFERLNTGGTSLLDQEVRNCVFRGKLNDLLHELNGGKSWRKILGKENADSRQRDVLLILRYMALFHKISTYKRPMKEFLKALHLIECADYS